MVKEFLVELNVTKNINISSDIMDYIPLLIYILVHVCICSGQYTLTICKILKNPVKDTKASTSIHGVVLSLVAIFFKKEKVCHELSHSYLYIIGNSPARLLPLTYTLTKVALSKIKGLTIHRESEGLVQGSNSPNGKKYYKK